MTYQKYSSYIFVLYTKLTRSWYIRDVSVYGETGLRYSTYNLGV